MYDCVYDSVLNELVNKDSDATTSVTRVCRYLGHTVISRRLVVTFCHLANAIAAAEAGYALLRPNKEREMSEGCY